MTMASDNDLQLFLSENLDVTPLKVEATVSQRMKQNKSPGLDARRAAAQLEIKQDNNFLADEEYVALVDPWDQLCFKRDGVQHGVFKNMRTGKYHIDAALDLHQHTVVQARKAVFEFIKEARQLDIRSVLITHGKGEYRKTPALLKSCVNHWLRQIDEVMAFHSAQQMHGGLGAVYILLRKTEKKQLEKLERHQTKRKGL